MLDAVVLDAVVLARSGDHAAFEVLARRSASRLDTVARLIVRDPDLAADAVQETLIRAWRDLPGLRDPAAFDGWLHRILVRACMDAGRQRQRLAAREVRVPQISTVGDATSRVEARDEMGRAFGRLRPAERAILALRFYADLSVEDTARAAAIPSGTVKSRINRALRSLQAALEAESRGDGRTGGGPSRPGADR